MRKLSSVVFLLVLSTSLFGQSPHGDDLAVDCKACHSASGWQLDRTVYSFEHDNTNFPLEGQHTLIDCKMCHASLVFDEAETTCMSCHTDIHNLTVGSDCARCHNSDSWLVEDITMVHEQNGFPLLGQHATANCAQCHTAAAQLQFQPIGHECINCHREDYQAAENPNHVEADYSTNCAECHNANTPEWTSSGLNHDFFPLTKGHDISDCAACHEQFGYQTISPDCFSCHEQDYTNASNPDHNGTAFSTNCTACHSTDLNWEPAKFDGHDAQFFPIYSGEHAGEWDKCSQCHTQANNFSSFSCLECHEHNQSDMDETHGDIEGYSYNSQACLACHSTGSSDVTFDHSRTAFPLTGAHQQVECLSCHTNGYAGTSTLCADCHMAEFDGAQHPNHRSLNLATDCASCHSTEPDWTPALFPNHNQYYVLNGAHATIARDCASCHTADFTNTPNTCAGCHTEDYKATHNPPHQSSGFSDDCASCHTETAWQPANFDHDGQYFPIYSGKHSGAWNDCAECHTTAGNFAAFSCVACHEHNKTKTDQEHNGVPGYDYNSESCLVCHPAGSSDGAFDHNNTNFPLTGAHATVECQSCHTTGYAGTSTLCADCHTADFNQTSNPSHTALALSNDCASCHTTDPGWSPATFPVHNEYYILAGAHMAIANDCASCHNGDYSNTPNTCAGCHIEEYNATNDPPHQSSGFSDDCASCHSQAAWQPANFDHDGQFFPIYSGKHNGVWNECAECHTTAGNFTAFSCVACHEHNKSKTDQEHNGVPGYNYSSESCLLCHPVGTADGAFDHNSTNFPLTGAHTIADCQSCHASGYAGTSTACIDCHTSDFNQTSNPNHTTLALSNDCASCHTTDPGWSPATFPVHNDYYVLAGAHAAIANACATCHNGDYANTPNTCAGCHVDDYNATTNPPHQSSGFTDDCTSCHSQAAWQPANFDHDGQFFPIYSGKHNGVWNECAECHTTAGNFAAFSCVACHEHNKSKTDQEHNGVPGYNYSSESCLLCHPTGTADGAFDHNSTNFPLTGAHTTVDCQSCHASGYAGTSTACVDCHTADFSQTSNPNHTALALSNDCASCHTTDPGWSPATFPVHNDYYILAGAHAAIASACATCHNGDYTNTPNTCAGCHIDDYNATNDPPHQSSGFSDDCASCHSETAWQPANFDHDGQFFPIYSGKHKDEWNQCTDCHTNANNYSIFTCIQCHEHSNKAEVDDDHSEVNDYQYNSPACYQCHPNGDD